MYSTRKSYTVPEAPTHTQVNTRIPIALYKRLRIHSAAIGQPIATIMQRLIATYLRDHPVA